MTELTNADLLNRLRSGEDHFTERKTFRDRNGWLKTVIAFANSAPIGWPGILFIGVTDEGVIQTPGQDLEQLAMDVSNEVARAYPPIYHLPKTVIDEDDRKCLAILVPGSDCRPHFSGKSFVRVGPRSEAASEKQFSELIAQRQSKVYELLKWKGKPITIEIHRNGPNGVYRAFAPETVLADVTQFYISLSLGKSPPISAYPLDRVRISLDPKKDRLKLEVEE